MEQRAIRRSLSRHMTSILSSIKRDELIHRLLHAYAYV
jgi:hypothetical protein